MTSARTRKSAGSCKPKGFVAPYGRLFIVGVISGVNLLHISNEDYRAAALVARHKLRPGETLVFFNNTRTRCRLLTLLETDPPMPLVQLVPYSHINTYRSHARVLEALVGYADTRTARSRMEIANNMAVRARDARKFADALEASRAQTLRAIKEA